MIVYIYVIYIYISISKLDYNFFHEYMHRYQKKTGPSAALEEEGLLSL